MGINYVDSFSLNYNPTRSIIKEKYYTKERLVMSMERLIIEMEKGKNEVVYVPLQSGVDVLTLEKTKITYDEVLEDIKENKNIYYEPKQERILDSKNKNTGDKISNGFRVAEITKNDIEGYTNEKIEFII